MARTKGTSNNKISPSKQFERQSAVGKLLIYNYWIYLETEGASGWDTKKAGSVGHWSSSQYIHDNIKKGSFYHQGKVSKRHVQWRLPNRRRTVATLYCLSHALHISFQRMAEIAKLLKEQGLKLVRPDKDTTLCIESEGEPADSEPEDTEEAEDSEPEYNMPSSILKTPTPKKRASIMNTPDSYDINRNLARLQLDGPITEQSIQGAISMIMVSGRWSEFDQEHEVNRGYCLMRMLVHSDAALTDFETSWHDEHTFNMKLKWPKYMEKCAMLTTLDTYKVPTDMDDDDANEVVERYPATHRVYDSIGMNVKKMKTAYPDKKMRNEGNFIFEYPMETTKGRVHLDLFEVPINGTKSTTILQILFHEKEESGDAETTSVATTTNRSGTVKFGELSTASLVPSRSLAAAAAALAATGGAPGRPVPGPDRPVPGRPPNRRGPARRGRSRSRKRDENDELELRERPNKMLAITNNVASPSSQTDQSAGPVFDPHFDSL